jgi:hypothetical protein
MLDSWLSPPLISFSDHQARSMPVDNRADIWSLREREPGATPDGLPICWLFRFGLEVAKAQGNKLEP